MSKTDKIIELLENCIKYDNTCSNCPYRDYSACRHFLMTDALKEIKGLRAAAGK